MLQGTGLLPLETGGGGGGVALRSARGERRDATVRMVEYAPFPRADRGQRWQVGFTLDLSPGGACLRVRCALPVGSLLRIVVRSIEGRPTLDSIARVAWCRPAGRGEFRVGLVRLASRAQARPPMAA